ncbi:MAG: hypothetical protein JXR97_04135, partial [Planctomycetes bacterium]|nr:hypothetical protein [Planctomycetota bacterium]
MRYIIFIAMFFACSFAFCGEEREKPPARDDDGIEVFVVTVDSKIQKGRFVGYEQGFLVIRQDKPAQELQISPNHIKVIFTDGKKAAEYLADPTAYAKKLREKTEDAYFARPVPP